MISAVVFGHLGQDAELKQVGGKPLLSLSVASNSRKKVGTEWVDATDWVRVSLFGERATKLAQHLTKGKGVVVRGSLTVREYEKAGAVKFSIDMRADDIEFAGGKGEGKTRAPVQSSAGGEAVDDEGLPF